VVDFWRLVPPCVRELPNVLKITKNIIPEGSKYRHQPGRDEKKLTDFTKQKNMPWQQYFRGKAEQQLAAKYGVSSIPAIYLLDTEGKIIGNGLRVRS